MIEFERFLIEKRDELEEKDPYRKYFEAQIAAFGNRKLRPNQFHRALIRKIIEAGPLFWTPKKLPEPEANRDLPRILYWMYGHEEDPQTRVDKYFRKNLLNSAGNLISFTQRPIEAAQYFGIGLRAEGIPGPLVVMLFPYETTNLRRWVEDPNSHHNLPGTRIFMTDQSLKREDTLLIEYTRIIHPDPFEPKNARNIQSFQFSDGKKPPILPPEKQTREVIMDMFDITPQYQEDLFHHFCR